MQACTSAAGGCCIEGISGGGRDKEIDSQADLPQTGNFGGYHKSEPAADKSNGGKTVMDGDQSPNLLDDDSS